jgi:hypothetical protein
MKNVNPLTILLASLLLVVIAVYSVGASKEKLATAKEDLVTYKNVASSFQSQYISYSDKKAIKKSLEKIIRSSQLKNARILDRNKIIKIEISSVNISRAQKFLNKLFNKKFNVKKVEILQNRIMIEIGTI